MRHPDRVPGDRKFICGGFYGNKGDKVCFRPIFRKCICVFGRSGRAAAGLAISETGSSSHGLSSISWWHMFLWLPG